MRICPPGPVFSRADARACGWSDAALTRAVRSGRVLRLRYDQFTQPEHRDDPRIKAAAAARACRGSVVSHRSAALFHELPLLRPAPSRPDLTISPRATGDVAGALLHRATLRADDVVDIGGVPVTSMPRTLIDLGRSMPTPAAVVAIDAAAHRGLVDATTLERAAHNCRNWPGICRAKRALAAADGRSESPLETVSRLIIAWLGLPTPGLQVPVHDDLGMFVGRPDFYWDGPGVAGEADGQNKYDSRTALVEEKRRQERLEALGLIVVRWDWNEVTRYPHLLRDRIKSAFERGNNRDRSGFPRGWSVRTA
jgi:hypothetical protein